MNKTILIVICMVIIMMIIAMVFVIDNTVKLNNELGNARKESQEIENYYMDKMSENNNLNNNSIDDKNKNIIQLSPSKKFDLKHFKSIDPDDDYYTFTYKDTVWGGLVQKYSASSELKNIGNNTYIASNLRLASKEEVSGDALYGNLDSSCWSEGVSGDGIGEFVEIHAYGSHEIIENQNLNQSHEQLINILKKGIYGYDTEHPTKLINGDEYNHFISTVAIVNGYIKSDETWKNNNRVKKFLLSINDEVFYELNLEDTKDIQLFDINYSCPINKLIDVKFVIKEVYKGEKYDDTCISMIDLKGGADFYQNWGGR